MAELQTVDVDARAVTLTELGERAHLISLAVALETRLRWNLALGFINRAS